MLDCVFSFSILLLELVTEIFRLQNKSPLQKADATSVYKEVGVRTGWQNFQVISSWFNSNVNFSKTHRHSHHWILSL